MFWLHFQPIRNPRSSERLEDGRQLVTVRGDVDDGEVGFQGVLVHPSAVDSIKRSPCFKGEAHTEIRLCLCVDLVEV